MANRTNRRLWNLANLMSGAVIGQLASIATIPTILLLYGPTVYGQLQIYISSSLLLLPLFTLRIPETALYCQLSSDRVKVYRSSAVWLVFAVIALLSVSPLVVYASTIQFVDIAIVTVITSFTAISTVAATEAAKTNNIAGMRDAKIVQPVVQNTLRIFGHGFFLDFLVLLISYVSGILCATCAYIRGRNLINSLSFSLKADILGLRSILQSNKKLVFRDNVANIAGTAREHAIILAGAVIFNDASLGVVALAMRVLGLPIQYISKSYLEIFKGEVMQAVNTGSGFEETYRQVGTQLAAVAAVVYSCTVFSILVFDNLLPLAWRSMADWIVPLALMNGMRCVATVLSFSFYATRNQQTDMVLQIVWAGVVACISYVSWAFQSGQLFVNFLSASAIVFYSFYVVMGYHYAK